MKYAWIEGTEIVQEEVFDEFGEPFDPPQYQDVEVPSGDGSVTGLNRGAQEGESEGNTTPQHLVWGMDNDFYSVIDYEFMAKTEQEVQAIRDQREADRIAEEEARAAEVVRVEDLATDGDTENFKKYTKEQVDSYLDNQYDPSGYQAAREDFDNAADNAELKIAIGLMFDEVIALMQGSKNVDQKIAKNLVAVLAVVDDQLVP